jgi:hypothetical protein
VAERLSILQQNVEYKLQGELAPGERLLWSGRPQGGIKFTATDAYRIPVSILFTGVSLDWTILAIAAGSGFMFALTGLPFLLFGLYMNFGRFPSMPGGATGRITDSPIAESSLSVAW